MYVKSSCVSVCLLLLYCCGLIAGKARPNVFVVAWIRRSIYNIVKFFFYVHAQVITIT